MLNAPLPPDVTVTDRLQMVISEWKGGQAGHPLARLHKDCLDLVGSEKQLLPLRLIPVRELDSVTLERALRRYRFPLHYAVEPVGRFEAALVPVLREDAPSPGFLFAYEEDLTIRDQVALFAHAVGHLILNDQERLKDHEPPLDPENGEIHTDKLSELRYLDVSRNRNYLDRQVLENFPKLTQLIEPPEESQVQLDQATRELERMLRSHDWSGPYVRMRYRYTQGRVIPNSQQRGKRQVVDALLRADASLPTAVVQVQRANETLQETVGRARRAAEQLFVPFAYVLTIQKEIFELDWLSGELSEPRLRTALPNRDELLTRWLTALQLNNNRDIATVSYPYDPTQTPRYYQEAAINQAIMATLQARKGLRPPRILLTLATGTGKTLVAFQILWKLKKTYRVRNVLFLADRGYLLEQAQNNTFGPFNDAIKRGSGEIDTAHDILFGTYQWLTMIQDGEERYKGYPPDYFDVIVIDECHRGSADENSNWRRVLEHFSEAVQIGLTATPLETKDVKTNDYFGKSVYTYTLSQGINDGYLAPYSVRRVLIEQVEQETAEAPQLATKPVETLDQEIVMQTGRAMRQYTQTIAEHLAHYLQLQADPRAHKTIVFCVNNDHADEMRLALEQSCAAWARPGDIVRIVDDDGPEGKRALNNFCTIRERQPVLVTTSRLLTTGVDAPTCRNIVLARGVGSLVEFKQIIGRGTRLSEPEKTWFTIIYYAGAIKHFSDPTFDGDPISVQREYLIPPTPASDANIETTVNEPTRPFAATISLEEERADEEAARAEPELPPTLEPEFETYPLVDDPVPDGASSHVIIDVASVYEMSIPAPSPDVPASSSATESALTTAGRDEREQRNGVQLEQELSSMGSRQESAATETRETQSETTIGAPPEPSREQTARPRKGTTQAPRIPRAPAAPEVTVPKANGHRFVISGERLYELDASGKRLREGTNRDFAQQALKDLVRTPEDLRQYWSNKDLRRSLIEQLTEQVVGLDALAEALNLPDVDHYDLLRHVLFQQPTLTRAERVARLHATHNSTFFQRFEHSPLAKELLDAILDKYIQGDAPDVSDIELLRVPPLAARTRKEWSDAVKALSPELSIGGVLRELQQLLYSV